MRKKKASYSSAVPASIQKTYESRWKGPSYLREVTISLERSGDSKDD